MTQDSARGDFGVPTVSVVVTNYNYDSFIQECLASIATQTLQPLECVIVDDGSTDQSVASIEQFIREYDGEVSFELVQSRENGGQMSAFKEGFRRTVGSFVVFVDADDTLFPDFVETHIKAHLNPRFTAALTCSNEVIGDSDKRILSGSIEKAHRPERARMRIAPHIPVKATAITEWKEVWEFHDAPKMKQETRPLLYVAPDANDIAEFIWTTTSAVMFRRAALEIALRNPPLDVRISADYYLLNYCHLLGGSLLIQSSHGMYRRHSHNNFANAPTIGRATRSWTAPEVLSRSGQLRRIEDSILDSFEAHRALMGEPRLLQLLASLVPMSRSIRVFRILEGRLLLQIQYLGLLLLKSVKKQLLHVIKLKRFV